jgi:hypothetical protein
VTAGAVNMLREQDQQFLADSALNYTVTVDGQFADMVITGFSTAPGLSLDTVDLLIRLPFGFPDAAPDMFWVMPNLSMATGQPIPGTEMTEAIVDRVWQRWSRHIAGQWRPGVDNLETYLAYIRRCLRQAGGN